MRKDAIVRITGIQRGENGAEERVTSEAFGSYQFREDCHYLEYRERTDDGDEQENYVALTEERLTVRKKGKIDTEMLFLPACTTAAEYQTPYGVIPIEIETFSVRYKLTKRKLLAQVSYILKMNGSFVSENKLRIEAEWRN